MSGLIPTSTHLVSSTKVQRVQEDFFSIPIPDRYSDKLRARRELLLVAGGEFEDENFDISDVVETEKDFRLYVRQTMVGTDYNKDLFPDVTPVEDLLDAAPRRAMIGLSAPVHETQWWQFEVVEDTTLPAGTWQSNDTDMPSGVRERAEALAAQCGKSDTVWYVKVGE
jgi:hypothetical protein